MPVESKFPAGVDPIDTEGVDRPAVCMGHIGEDGAEATTYGDVVLVPPEPPKANGAKLVGSGVCDMPCTEVGTNSHGYDTDEITSFHERNTGRISVPKDECDPAGCEVPASKC